MLKLRSLLLTLALTLLLGSALAQAGGIHCQTCNPPGPEEKCLPRPECYKPSCEQDGRSGQVCMDTQNKCLGVCGTTPQDDHVSCVCSAFWIDHKADSRGLCWNWNPATHRCED